MKSSFSRQKIQKTLKVGAKSFQICHINSLPKLGFKSPEKLPFSIKVLLESAVRNFDDFAVTEKDIKTLLSWSPTNKTAKEIAFKPGRVVLQDFTGVPCVVDLAALRSAMKRMGGDYKKINPQVQCDLVIDHSVQVDYFGTAASLGQNVKKEFQRNKERYEFLKWGQNAFKNFRVVPPATGIVHQVNLEYLATGVLKKKEGKETFLYPDSLVGTDSHTTMINGLGIVGWGVGGIEAEAVMLGEPINMLMPEVVGYELKGKLREGVTATDLVLTIVEALRKKGVVGKFVEFYGDGLKHLTLPDRATISNMAPEYGATIGIFPIDEETLNYYRLTGRSNADVELIEKYFKAQGMFYTPGDKAPKFTDSLTLNLDNVEPSLAGPKRPQDRVALSNMKTAFDQIIKTPVKDRGFALTKKEIDTKVTYTKGKSSAEMTHGSVVIAAITSCTNTSNPSVLIAAALLAKNAVELGLKVKPYVKTSLAPGSQVVTEYLENSGLMSYLDKLGFNVVGYGCTTCIGNSGPLPDDVAKAVNKGDLVAASVLSGNRNFEGRVNPLVKANYLASPPLVVAYALAGKVDVNLFDEPLGVDQDGNDVFLADVWPSTKEIHAVLNKFVTAKAFKKRYKNVATGNEDWNKVKAVSEDLYKWKPKSTYIQEPPFFVDMDTDAEIKGIEGARCLVMVGDSITTDHISPAGAISSDSPAGKFLKDSGIDAKDFNSYGSRRGNDRVMTRGTFANIRLRNQLAPGTEGSWTTHFPTKKKISIYDASLKYKDAGTPLVVLAGKEYGTGSSRDWAAKGTALLGVRAVIAESYERIHRSNLAGMGVLPLQFEEGKSAEKLGLVGDEIFDFEGVNEKIKPLQTIKVTATSPKGKKTVFNAKVRLDTPVEIDYFRNGGILQTVLLKLAK